MVLQPELIPVYSYIPHWANQIMVANYLFTQSLIYINSHSFNLGITHNKAPRLIGIALSNKEILNY